MNYPLGQLLRYCARNNYGIIRIYETTGETRDYQRAIVRDIKGNKFYLYYDSTSKRTKKFCPTCKKSFQEHIMMENTSACSNRLDQFMSPRGWRNVTKDNHKKKSRLNARARQQLLAAYR